MDLIGKRVASTIFLPVLMMAGTVHGQIDCTKNPESPDCQGGGASGEALLVVAVVAGGIAWAINQSRARQRVCRLRYNSEQVLQNYDDNKNCRISCKEARRHGIAPVSSDQEAYRYMRDRDKDGVACE